MIHKPELKLLYAAMISKRTKTSTIYTIIWRFPSACLMPLVSKAAVWRVPIKRCAIEQYSCGANKQHWGQFSAATITPRVWGCLFFLNINQDVCTYTKIFKKTRVGERWILWFFNLGRENPPSSPHMLATFGSERMIFILGRAWWVGFGQMTTGVVEASWVFFVGWDLVANKGGKNRTKNGRNLRDSVREMGGFFWLAGIYTYVYIL